MDSSFADQHVVVTGGSSGIGRATALAFAERGAASVVITGRRAELLAEVAAAHPGVLVPVVADVATEEGTAAVVDAVRERGGHCDVLVHNAGIYRLSMLEHPDHQLARAMVDTNLLGPVTLTASLLPLLRSPGAAIVFVSSVNGHLPTPGGSVYAATKAGLDSLTRSWAVELAPRGVRVNAVAPGVVRTEVFRSAGFPAEANASVWEGYATEAPLGRIGEVDDVTPWITRLADRRSSWVTGQIITLDGGWDLTH